MSPTSQDPRETRLALAVVVGAWALLLGPFLLTPGLPVYRDLLLTYLPARRFWAEQVMQLQLPLWFPYEGLGRAFLGQGVTSTFYPLNALYLLGLPEALALRLELATALLVGLTGQALFARQLGVRAVGAVTGAFALAFSGYALSMTSNLAYLRGLTMLPWVALFATRLVTRPSAPGALAGLALAWALIPLGGDAAATLLAGLVVLAVLVVHRARTPRLLLQVAVAAVLAGLLAAPELLPASALHRDSIVAQFQNADFLSRFWALHPERLPELLLAGVGSPSAPLPSAAALHEPGRWAESVLLGAPVVVLALSTPARRAPLTFLSLGLLGLWLALGAHGGLDLALRTVLPPLNTVRYPEKHLALAVFGLATAAAFGAERLVEGARRAVLPVALTAGLTLVSAVRLDVASPLALALAGALAVGLISLVSRRDVRAAWLFPSLVALTLWRLPLGLVTVPEDVLDAPPRVPGTGRVWSERYARAVPTDAESLEAWALEEVASLSGDLGVYRRRGSLGLTANLPLAPRRERAVFGWTLSDTRPLAPLFGFDAALRADGTDEALEAVPRVWVASGVGLTEPKELLARLRAAPRAAFEHPLVLAPQPPLMEGPIGAASVLSDQGSRVVVDVDVQQPGVLVLNDLVADGWRVKVDEQPAPLLVVNALVRGVNVPPGHHRVTFSYEAPRLGLGLSLGAGAVIAVLGLLLRALARAKTRPTE